MLFTAFPLGVRSLFDQDTHFQEHKVTTDSNGNKIDVVIEYARLKRLNPYFYRRGQLNKSFTNGVFTAWITKGIVHGFLIWLTSSFSSRLAILDIDGRNSDFWFTSITMFTSIYLVGYCYSSARYATTCS